MFIDHGSGIVMEEKLASEDNLTINKAIFYNNFLIMSEREAAPDAGLQHLGRKKGRADDPESA